MILSISRNNKCYDISISVFYAFKVWDTKLSYLIMRMIHIHNSISNLLTQKNNVKNILIIAKNTVAVICNS